MELWKDIANYEGIYQVSSYGRVRGLDRIDSHGQKRAGKIMKLHDSNTGYVKVMLCKGGNSKFINVHRLVANAFVQNPNSFTTVNHKDENKHNNFSCNLEWCTPKYNSNYGKAQEKRSKKLYVKIDQFDQCGRFIKNWESIKSAAEELNIPAKSIGLAASWKRKSAGGFLWEYAGE